MARCWNCRHFKNRNGQPCKDDAEHRNKVYALDYICANFEAVEGFNKPKDDTVQFTGGLER